MLKIFQEICLTCNTSNTRKTVCETEKAIRLYQRSNPARLLFVRAGRFRTGSWMLWWHPSAAKQASFMNRSCEGFRSWKNDTQLSWPSLEKIEAINSMSAIAEQTDAYLARVVESLGA